MSSTSRGVAQRSLPAWWLLRSDKTRSHPELGRQTLKRPWYCVSRRGRVGRRQARKERPLNSCQTWYKLAAGWSSPVARQAHNLKAAGSNPAPATNFSTSLEAKTAVNLAVCARCMVSRWHSSRRLHVKKAVTAIWASVQSLGSIAASAMTPGSSAPPSIQSQARRCVHLDLLSSQGLEDRATSSDWFVSRLCYAPRHQALIFRLGAERCRIKARLDPESGAFVVIARRFDRAA